jgi:hypothetical protein
MHDDKGKPENSGLNVAAEWFVLPLPILEVPD